MLAVRPWTGYELTQQVRRSLRFVWPSSEGHLYREQKRLVLLGWATLEREASGRRRRNRYTITEAGRAALRSWLASAPEEPHFQIEGVLRTFYADQGSPEQLAASMRATADAARSMLVELRGFAAEYLEPGGPMSLLEEGIGGPGRPRREFHGRTMYPERLPSVALAIDITTRLLETLDSFFTEEAARAATWPATTDPALTGQTKQRLERILARAEEISRATTT